MIKAVIGFAALAALFLLLYERGYMTINSKSAATFIGSPGGTGARFTSCSGSIKRIVRFKEDGTYTFFLDTDLTKGHVSIELLDTHKHPLMQLDPAHPRGSVTAERGKKYLLITRFRSATGRYSLIRE